MSFLFDLDPKEEAAAEFVSEAGRGLQQALLDRKQISKLTQQAMAEALGVDRSRVNKCFSGYANLTLEKLAELCWSMDVKPHVIFEQLLKPGATNYPPALPRTSIPAAVGMSQSPLPRASTTYTNAPKVTVVQ